MKILTIVVIALSLGCIIGKDKNTIQKTQKVQKTVSNVKKSEQIKVDHLPDTPLVGAVPNDPYTLQHQAVSEMVNILIHINKFKNLLSLRE